MSVFQLQEWWSVKVTQDATEEFDLSCFCIGNADNSYPAANKIIVGSQAGVLRMYHPTRPTYRIEDLVLEEMLGAPILQVALGRFIPGSELLGVAILHPRELVVYEVLPQAVKDDRVSYYTMRRVYSHDLGIDGKHFTAFNMAFGAFGGVRGRDMIIVQSMDGKLQIFEQSAHAFTRQLADCLLPGPLYYVPKIDAFITVNYSGFAECYRYQVLASSQSESVERRGESKGDSKSGDTGAFGIRAVRSNVCEWTVNLGECARQILLGSFLVNENGVVLNSGPANELLFVCEKSIFLVKAETGGIIQQRRIDRSESSCASLIPYVAEMPNGQTTTAHNFVIADQEGTVHVYQGFNLMWAARLTSSPVYMAVSSFGGQRGLIVTIDDCGYLSIGYLGTKPPVQAVLSQVRDLDYDKIDEEHRALLQVIRDSQNENKNDSQDRLLIKSQIPKTFDLDPVYQLHSELPVTELVHFPSNTTQGGGGGNQEPLVKVTVRIFFTYTGLQAASNVSVVITPPASVHVHPNHVVFQQVAGVKSTPTVLRATFFALKSAVTTDLAVTVTASYQSPKGEQGVVTHSFELPLCLSLRPRPPTKSAPVKLILDTEFPAVPLTDLFADVLHAFQETGMDVSDVLGQNATQALGFVTQAPVLKIDASLSNAWQQTMQQIGLLEKLPMLSPSFAADAEAIQLSGSPNFPDAHFPMPDILHSSPLISILVSKNAGRYRIQSESFSGLSALCLELEKRLHKKLIDSTQSSSSSEVAGAAVNGSSSSSSVVFQEALPTEEFLQYVSQHLSLRHIVLYKNRILQDRATQYRMIEKRLLVRFKDKNPSPLHGLDTMLQDTYMQILTLADEIEKIQSVLVQLRNEIDAFAKLLVSLIGMKLKLPLADRQALLSYFCPQLRDGLEQGWEENVTANLAFALKTSLSRSGPKESSAVSTQMSSVSLEIPKNLDHFRKNFLLVIDRLERGGRLVAPASSTNAGSSNSNSSNSGVGDANAEKSATSRKDRK